jgi:hypothetical protein
VACSSRTKIVCFAKQKNIFDTKQVRIVLGATTFDIMTHSIKPLCIIGLSIKQLCIMALRIKLFIIMVLSIKPFIIMVLSIKPLCIMALGITSLSNGHSE